MTQSTLIKASLLALSVVAPMASALPIAAQTFSQFGPYHAEFIAGGDGIVKATPGARVVDPYARRDFWGVSGEYLANNRPNPDFAAGKNALDLGPAWTLSGWVLVDKAPSGRALIAGFGAPDANNSYYLTVTNGKFGLSSGATEDILSKADIADKGWHFVTATNFSGEITLYVDGKAVGSGRVTNERADALVGLGPRIGPAPGSNNFSGKVANFGLYPDLLPAKAILAKAKSKPDFSLLNFEQGSPSWPIQVSQQIGQVIPQDAWTLPKSNEPFSKPKAKPLPKIATLSPGKDGAMDVNGWRLLSARETKGGGPELSKPGYNAASWYAATVPGTVLSTLIDRGVYPDPDYGLNNMAIPEDLHKQDWWYRTEFTPPANMAGRTLTLTFKGINYAAEFWVNGEKLTDITGAFIRGKVDVTKYTANGGKIAVAVKIKPPPHPGVAHEESLTSGEGDNGGMMTLDGPTFMSSEGWDWIPTVRDRNIGLWRGVELRATGAAEIGDTQVITSLPNNDGSLANISINVPVVNAGKAAVTADVTAAFGDLKVTKSVTLAPGSGTVSFTPSEFPALVVKNPKLWWPNGYGDPVLQTLNVTVSINGAVSDAKSSRFGIREVTYELSAVDTAGDIKRLELDTTKAREIGDVVLDVSHEAIRKVVGGWAVGLKPGMEKSPAVTPLTDDSLSPFLVLKVNGVKIAARGGNWGKTDWRKRVSREKLEPAFKLHKDANLNIIRNWVGQSTEEEFFELADEYGMMVLNDFWVTTQDYNVEPQDDALQLANARDMVRRYRNHPSIVLWLGRNEGVPKPILNMAFDELIRTEDGTRYYTGSSNRVNVQGSGPYNYREPVGYFTEYSRGFAIEVGTPSFPTREAWERIMAKSELWPISDTWAYHDWHQAGNGAVASFMKAMEDKFGKATSFEDFERKAQMMNYETHRAMFEGMNAHLWSLTSGRMLWMTHPAWVSSAWQIYTADYDTHGAYYGVKEASEKIHVQMNLPDFQLAVINNALTPIDGATLRARVFALDNRLLGDESLAVSAAANGVLNVKKLALDPLLDKEGVVLVKLELVAADGKLLSENFYWQAKDAPSTQKLNTLPEVKLAANAVSVAQGDEIVVTATLTNTGAATSLNTKLLLNAADGSQILPAYFSENYVSILPGEARVVEIKYPAKLGARGVKLEWRAWNVASATAVVTAKP